MLKSIRENMTWSAVPTAGFAGGTVFLLTLILLAPGLLGIRPTVPLYYMAALVLGTSVLVEQSLPVLVTGVLVHYALSVVFALVIAVVVHRWGLLVGVVGGGVLGLSLYAINLYTMTLFFPWFFAINGGLLAAAHILFGIVAGGVYEALDQFDINRQQQAQGVTHETA